MSVAKYVAYTVIFSHFTNWPIAEGMAITSFASIYWLIAVILEWIQSRAYIGKNAREVNLCSFPWLWRSCLAPVNHCIISVRLAIRHKSSFMTVIGQVSATRSHCPIAAGISECNSSRSRHSSRSMYRYLHGLVSQNFDARQQEIRHHLS